uniref:Uncharacterized protein n=1 Tax=Anguilla anguilla TaxID=7936 RepID=A0A0E9R8W9_ANGAN
MKFRRNLVEEFAYSSSSSVRLDTLLTTCASPGIELSLVTQKGKGWAKAKASPI